MGDINQLLYIKKFANELKGPYLEVGSKNYGNTQDLRPILSNGDKYIGVDLEQGQGVDLVLNLTDDFEEIDKKLNGERFGTIICLSVLEHSVNPFAMAENLTRLLKDGGKIIISVPFAWKFHGYPSDYWRFTYEGVKRLFPRIVFDLEQGVSTTPNCKKAGPLDEKVGIIPFSFKENWSKGYKIRGISAKVLKLLGNIGLFRWLTGNKYVLGATLINMIGVLDKKKITHD